MAFGPLYSYVGEVAVISTTDRATLQHFNIIAFDTETGEQIAELWDGAGTSLEPLQFSPQPGDLRLLGTTNRSGLKRPFLWNPRTGERTDLDFQDLAGEVIPLDWSPDGTYILLCQFDQIGVSHRPKGITLIAKVFKSQTGFREIGRHFRTPVLEILDTPYLHFRVMDIDPVVWEKLCFIDN